MNQEDEVNVSESQENTSIAGSENTMEDVTTRKSASGRKPTRKRNAGARKSAKGSAGSEGDSEAVPSSFSTTDDDMVEQNSFEEENNEHSADSSKDEAKPVTDASPGNGSPRSANAKPQGGNRKQNDRQGKGHKFNNKFNNKAKKKARWQKNRPRAAREESSGLDYGELPAYELFGDFDAIEQLANDMASGEASPLNFNHIYQLPLPELRSEVESLPDALSSSAPARDQLIHACMEYAASQKSPIESEGVLDLLDDDEGGLLVYACDSYRQRGLSAYVPQKLIEKYGLQRGHMIKAQLHPHRENETCPFVVRISEVMGRDPASLGEIVPFKERVPYYPTSRILLETNADASWDNLSMRVVDCLTPIGFGQRGLIVAPPRTGKTVLLQSMANAIQSSYPEAHLIVLLIDERPEEVTDFRRQCSGEVISSTFDESAESHVHAAEMVIDKARRMVEVGRDVIILLDSITRLARAYNTMMPNSGKILSGGVEANALQRPKRFFGSARNIEDGGSLTILGTALVETGSKMDEVIFEEFKGTGNMELHLDRGLSDKRIFPALDMEKSGTRKEELLYHPDEMQKIYSLRRAMKGIPSVDAMEMLIQRIKKTGSNAEFLMSVSR